MLWFAFGCAVPEVDLTVTLANVASAPLTASDDSEHEVKFAPGLVVVHTDAFALFEAGGTATPELEALAEDGDPTAIKEQLVANAEVVEALVVAREDEVTYEDAPMFPGQSAYAALTAVPGDAFVTVAFMFGESNDVLIASSAVPVTVDGAANTGDWSSQLGLWDAGTEVNEEPGLGPNQAPRQASAGAGEPEGGVITAIDGTDAAGFAYPDAAGIASLTVTSP